MKVGSERILGLIRERITDNQHKRAGVGTFTPFQLPARDQPNAIDLNRSVWSLGDMLAFYDRQFVRHAYIVLLKRDPDEVGLTSRLEALQQGTMTRVELLFRLRYGPEGKTHKVRIRGLVKAFVLERLCAIPVLGLIPRTLRALAYLPQLQSDIQDLKAALAMQKNESDDRLTSVVEFQNSEFNKLNTFVDKNKNR